MEERLHAMLLSIPGAVAVVPMLSDHEVVFVRQFRYPVGKVLLEIPAGTLQQGEDPLKCARRELLEETGLHATELEKVMMCYLAPGYSSELIHIYLAKGLVEERQRADLDEFIQTEVFHIKNAWAMVQKGLIEDAKTISALALLVHSKL